MEPYATTSALPLKNETSCGAKMSNGIVRMTVATTDMMNAVRAPFLARPT